MATTNYYTVNGRIRGESTGGVRTTYGTDALGSVTGTYDQNGNPQNTYLWAPYGTLIQKTGTATDPKFGWNGSSGYRNTGRSYSGLYVRRRHYDFNTGQWSTLDPLWPNELAYQYLGAKPSFMIDPSGLCERALWEEVGFLTTWFGAAPTKQQQNSYNACQILLNCAEMAPPCSKMGNRPKPTPAVLMCLMWQEGTCGLNENSDGSLSLTAVALSALINEAGCSWLSGLSWDQFKQLPDCLKVMAGAEYLQWAGLAGFSGFGPGGSLNQLMDNCTCCFQYTLGGYSCLQQMHP